MPSGVAPKKDRKGLVATNLLAVYVTLEWHLLVSVQYLDTGLPDLVIVDGDATAVVSFLYFLWSCEVNLTA